MNSIFQWMSASFLTSCAVYSWAFLVTEMLHYHCNFRFIFFSPHAKALCPLIRGIGCSHCEGRGVQCRGKAERAWPRLLEIHIIHKRHWQRVRTWWSRRDSVRETIHRGLLSGYITDSCHFVCCALKGSSKDKVILETDRILSAATGLKIYVLPRGVCDLHSLLLLMPMDGAQEWETCLTTACQLSDVVGTDKTQSPALNLHSTGKSSQERCGQNGRVRWISRSCSKTWSK